ncbi:MAG: tetratricopeptide repeat protein [Anaerolineales bacterium]|nr:tetratricopeptide repeat protein [Anaerolineales bacterium]
MTLNIHFLGHLRLFQEGKAYKFTVLPKAHQLLAYLLLHRETAVPRDHLAFLLWDDVPESEARANLRRHLHDLRRALPKGTEWLISDSKNIRWNVEAPIWFDVATFEELCQDNNHLSEAVVLYTGDLLTDLYDDWLIPHREQLQELYFTTMTRLINRERERGDLTQAMMYARQLLGHDPLREDVVRDLILMRHESGDRSGALQLYQQFQARLADELGVEPMPETTVVYKAILENTLSIEGRTEVQTVLSKPKHNLPLFPVSFLGRREELSHISEQLGQSASAVRLLTITGPGGSGKTRLAIEAAVQLREQAAALFPDGIYFVPLAELVDPDQIPAMVLQTLQINPKNQDPATAVREQLQNKKMLLILDNFEHLLPATQAVSQWLSRAPHLHILVTSQVPLHLYGEHELPLDPLPLPTDKVIDPTELLKYPAIALFVDRARAVRPDFNLTSENAAAVAEICASLDGMPLAIELAAARSKFFTPAAMCTQLQQRLHFLTGRVRDLAVRQQTLRATIDWSYNLLTPEEQTLFRSLAVFSGTFDMAAAEAIGTAVIPATADFYELLEALIDKNMVRQRPSMQPTFRLLSTLREYGLEKLTQSAMTAQVNDLHGRYYRQWTEAAEMGLRTPQQKQWIEQFSYVETNVMAALRWLFHEPDHLLNCTEGALLTAALERFLILKGYLNEAYHWLQIALGYRQQLPADQQVRLLNKSGSCAQWLGKYEQAQVWHEEALQLSRKNNDKVGLAHTLHFLGNIAGRQGDYATSRELLTESLVYHRRLPDITLNQLNPLLNNLAIVERRLGNLEAAAQLLDEVIAIRRVSNDLLGLASTLNNLGTLYLFQECYDEAAALFYESLTISQTTKDQLSLIASIAHVAHWSALQNWHEQAIRLYAAVATQRQLLNTPATADVQSDQEKYLTQVHSQIDAAVYEQAWQAGSQLTLEAALHEASQLIQPVLP